MTTSSTTISTNSRLIIFDECIGKPYVEKLRAVAAGIAAYDATIEHIIDFQLGGQWDEHWIPCIADRDAIVISQDRSNKVTSKGQPLSRVCLMYGVTHVLLSARAGELKMPDKMLAILSVWKDIIDLFDKPRGQRFHLQLRPDIQNQGRLIDKTPLDAPIIPPKGQLF